MGISFRLPVNLILIEPVLPDAGAGNVRENQTAVATVVRQQPCLYVHNVCDLLQPDPSRASSFSPIFADWFPEQMSCTTEADRSDGPADCL